MYRTMLLVCYEECKTGTDNDGEECCTFNISVTVENLSPSSG